MAESSYNCYSCGFLNNKTKVICEKCGTPGAIAALQSTGKGCVPESYLWPLFPHDLSIGFAPDCDVVIPGKNIEASHCRLNYMKKSFFIAVAPNDPPILLSGRKVTAGMKQRIADKSTIKIGSEEFKIIYFNTATTDASVTESDKRDLKVMAENSINQVSSRLIKIVSINQKLLECQTAHDVYETVIDSVLNMTGLDRGYGFRVKIDGEQLNVKEVMARTSTGETFNEKDFTISRSIMTKVLESGGAAIIEDADTNVNSTVSMFNFNIKTVVCLPLMGRNDNGEKELIGIIYADKTLNTNPLPEGITKSMQTLCQIGASNLDRCIRGEEIVQISKEYDNYFSNLSQELNKIFEYLKTVSVNMNQSPDADPQVFQNHLMECSQAMDILVSNVRQAC